MHDQRETTLTNGGRVNGGGRPYLSGPVGADSLGERVDSPRQVTRTDDKPGFVQRHAALLGGAAVLLLGCGIRISLIIQDRLGHLPDTDLFLSWTRSLAEHGLGGFFEATKFCDYPPFFLLVMWVVGHGASLFEGALANDHLLRILLKAPACLADLGIAVLLLVEGRRLLGGRRAVGAAALYFLNPVAIYNSAYWGQVDAIHTALIVFTVMMVARGRWGVAGGAMALALLQKFQSIAFAPLLFFEAYRYRKWRGVGVTLIGCTVASAWLLLPFGLQGVLDDVLHRGYVGVIGQYNELSPSAFNVWHLVADPDLPDTSVPMSVAQAASGGRVSMAADASPLLRLSWRNISLIGYSLAVALILSVYSYRPGAIARAGAAGLLGLAFFLLPTEMHERYAHPAIALLALWAASGLWRERAFVMLSILLLLNLSTILPADAVATHIAAGIVGLFVVMLVWAMFLKGPAVDAPPEGAAFSPEPQPPLPGLVLWFRRATFLSLIIVSALAASVAQQARGASDLAVDGDATYLDALTPVDVRQDWGDYRSNRSVLGGVIRLKDTFYLRGLGTHAPSTLTFDIPPGSDVFRAVVGLDHETGGKGSAIAVVELDGQRVFESALLSGSGDPVELEVELGDARSISLKTIPGPDGSASDHVDWAIARFDPAS